MRGTDRLGAIPRVSVLVPVHDPGPSFLRAALASIRNQTLREGFEALLLDDGCTDGSGEIMQAVADADPRFR
ncbi:MAG: glycosyltransferase family 2 protein, partial [Planctomycetota bacterium]